MENLTEFERKLAERTPRLRRDVKTEVLRIMNQPAIWLKLRKFHNTVQNNCRQLREFLHQSVMFGICCFFLGAAAMYGVMNYYYGNLNKNLSENSSIKMNQEVVKYELVPMPIAAEFLDDINSPLQLIQKIPKQKIIHLKYPQQESTHYQLLRDLQM
ncbi:MAG: hypothetical protein LBC74_07650 [Planctomycetaceae bacterium]|jgi:hypothetical protein|nr:hypothetical protein [Planctomycetaceae bacterium]